MKILFDQNISFRVVKSLKELYPFAKQVRELGLENSKDNIIWEYAKKNNYTIVTFDSDFYDFVTLYGHPPKVIWIRKGNTSTNNLIQTFQENFEAVQKFILDNNFKEIGCLEIL